MITEQMFYGHLLSVSTKAEQYVNVVDSAWVDDVFIDDALFDGGYVYQLDFLGPYDRIKHGCYSQGRRVVVDKDTGKLLRATWTDEENVVIHRDQPDEQIFLETAELNALGDIAGLYPPWEVVEYMTVETGCEVAI